MKAIQSSDTLIHPGFMPYVTINQVGVNDFLKAVAVNGVGQAITLAALARIFHESRSAEQP
jgi:hypothetical protein